MAKRAVCPHCYADKVLQSRRVTADLVQCESCGTIYEEGVLENEWTAATAHRFYVQGVNDTIRRLKDER